MAGLLKKAVLLTILAVLLLGCIKSQAGWQAAKPTASATIAPTETPQSNDNSTQIEAPKNIVAASATPTLAATPTANATPQKSFGMSWSLLTCSGCKERSGVNFTIGTTSPVLQAFLFNSETEEIDNVYYGAYCARRDRNEPISAPYNGNWGKANPGPGDFDIGIVAANGSLQKTFLFNLPAQNNTVVQMQGFAVPEQAKRYSEVFYDCYLLAQNFASNAIKIRANQIFFTLNFTATDQ